MMDKKIIGIAYQWIIFLLNLLVCIQEIYGQSCGPRVSARLLAEIPCDMSKSSYCSAPGSAYPWNSVKRYINDNQGLVRRMYGDEKHSSVLLNEMDGGFQLKFEQLRAFMTRGYGGSRTEYGRSARGSQRQPRPQIFRDEDPAPATIFRVVTETSIKVGEPVTRPMTSPPPEESTRETVRTAAGFRTELHTTSSPSAATTEPLASRSSAATTEPLASRSPEATPVPTNTGDPTTTTERVEDTTITTDAVPTNNASSRQHSSSIGTTEIPPPPVVSAADTTTTTTMPEDLPVAMERIVAEEDMEEDYDYEPGGRKAESSVVALNSVEEKMRRKQQGAEVKRNSNNHHPASKYGQEDASMYEVEVDDDVTKGPVSAAVTEAKSEGDQTTEEVPRRGINACPVKNEVIAPYWANNTRGETLALLNVHPFEQYVHFEKCAFENHQMLCREGCRCEQQYRLHRLLAFDPKNECRGIFSDWFRFPSCCVCICYDLTPDIPRTRSRKSRMK